MRFIMKYRTTTKDIRQKQACGYKVFRAGYCEMQTLLHNHEPEAYTAGVYGWNFDVYNVYGVLITTGYRGMVGERLKGLKEAEENARRLDWTTSRESGLTYEERYEEIELLLNNLIAENMKEEA